MSKKAAMVLIAAAVLLGAVGGGNMLSAQGEGGVSPQAVVTPLLQYQGRLSDPATGDPVADGVYQVSFRLYNVEAGGTPLWTETEDVPVQGGLFSNALGDSTALDPALFNGQALWLGIKVGADPEATPRQQVLPVAYALSLVPGAVVEASSGPVLQVNNTGGGEALSVDGDLNVSGGLTGGSHNHSGAHITSGTVVDARIDGVIARDAEVTSAISGHTGDPDAHHVRYTDAEAWNYVLANDGTGSTLDADLLDGYQGSALFALGEDEVVSGLPRFYGGTSGSTSPFYVDSNYGVTNLNADYLDGQHASAFAGASHAHDDRYYTESESESRYVNVTGDTMNGGLVVLASASHGISSQTSSSASGAAGVEGKNTGSGYGVLGGSVASHGVYGYSTASGGYGVYGSSSGSSGRGVYGAATASSGTTYGVYGYSSSGTGYGVYGNAGASSGYSYGVYGYSSSISGRGVFGAAGASSGATQGVYGRSDSISGYGVQGSALATSGSRYGVYGWVNGTGYGLYTEDNLYVGGSCTGCTMVFVARNTSQDALRVGDVVAASGVGPVLAGHTAPVLEVRHATDSDTSVLGVVYSRGEFYAASGKWEEDGDSVQPVDGDGDSVQPVEGDAAPGDYLLVVTSGLAQVRVAPGLTGLAPGQRLAAGEVAGLVTLAGADAKLDLVFARAMEAKPDENGLLWALVSTQ